MGKLMAKCSAGDESAANHIADPASPGATYVQAEVVALRTAILAILVVLENAGLVKTS